MESIASTANGGIGCPRFMTCNEATACMAARQSEAAKSFVLGNWPN